MSIFSLYSSQQRFIPGSSAIAAIQNAVTLWGDFTRYTNAAIQFTERYPNDEIFDLECATCKKQIASTEIDVILFKRQFNNLNNQEAFDMLKASIDEEIDILLNKTRDDLKKWTIDATHTHNCNCSCGALAWQLVDETPVQTQSIVEIEKTETI